MTSVDAVCLGLIDHLFKLDPIIHFHLGKTPEAPKEALATKPTNPPSYLSSPHISTRTSLS